MDQNPLPRGSLQICDRLGKERWAVPEPAEAAVAVEAQYPAYPPSAPITVEVFRIGRAADRAAAVLSSEELVELHLRTARRAAGIATRRAGTADGDVGVR